MKRKAFAGISPYLCDKKAGQEGADDVTGQVFHCLFFLGKDSRPTNDIEPCMPTGHQHVYKIPGDFAFEVILFTIQNLIII